ncbi:MAG: exo-alpha-sialidase [Candidatus Omnitrophica bacterium]|nr:exo-alpha-sialidase [Candidatus Omnitrophota bacterium]MCB9781797.1 exo-alpha-sialidase [Candidatus Omnitrophota bacterium]
MNCCHRLLILLLALAPIGAGHAIELASKEIFIPSSTPGVRINGYAYYSETEGTKMIRQYGQQTVSDKSDVAYQEVSLDNGKTWKPLDVIVTNRPLEEGTWRHGIRGGFADPDQGLLINILTRGVFPTDNPLEGMTQWTLHYRLSRIDANGEPILLYQSPILESGRDSTPESPLTGVTIGHNAAMIGDMTCAMVKIDSGEVLQPVQISPTGPDGHFHNPGGGYTYHNSAVLIGKWNDRKTIDWRLSQLVVADPEKTTRGLLEPTVSQFDDGRILMVMRASNDKRPELPSYRWYSVSEDRGRTWSEAQPWTYTNGENFFSPSSCSMLLKHSNGKTYWIGNINPENSHGNLPRYPFLIGEVDPESLLLVKDSLCTLDDRQEGDWERLLLSNFFAQEDRVSHEIVVYMSPLFRKVPEPTADGKKPPLDWTADLYRYRVDVD